MATTPRVSRRSILTLVSATFAGTALVVAPLSLAKASAPAAQAPDQAPDPALEAVRNCDAALQKFKAIMEDPDGEDLVDEASDDSLEAWYELCEVIPTTVAGAAALVSYMAVYSEEEGGSDTAQEALTALAASLRKFANAAGQEDSHA
jgi:hypothetical protein